MVELSRGTERIAQADEAVAAGEEGMLRTLSEDERERFWVLLREVGDAAKLCPNTPLPDAVPRAGGAAAPDRGPGSGSRRA